jgi:hypothetical protein
MRSFAVLSRRISVAALLGVFVAWAVMLGPRHAQAQASVPDMTQFGFPTVVGSVTFTPGQANTLTAGNQKLEMPADMISKTVTFEFLQGDPSFFAQHLEEDDQGKPILANFAFRVTDTNTGQLVGRFDKPVVWSITDPQIGSDSEVYNVSAANPPKITENSTPGTIQGNTLSHPFGGASVGWLVVNPASPVGMPRTGATSANSLTSLALIVLLAAVVTLSIGAVLRRKAKSAV